MDQPDHDSTESAAATELLGLSNWGRWGAEDERGALNLVTPDHVLRALATVKEGVVLPLGQEIRGGRLGGYHAKSAGYTGPIQAGRPQPLQLMTVDGGDYVTGPAADTEERVAEDTIMLPVHGAATHIDGLAHVWSDGAMYNAFSGNLVRSYGAIRLGIENVAGLITRGIMLDMASYRGVATMDADDLITERDVVDYCVERGIVINAGDAVLVHTGWPKVFAHDPQKYAALQPGVGASAALYLAKRDICLLGSDTIEVQPFDGRNARTHDAIPDRRQSAAGRLHASYLGRLGIYLLEMLELSQLASAGLSEFLFVVAPLRIKGGTGSPVNPLAVY